MSKILLLRSLVIGTVVGVIGVALGHSLGWSFTKILLFNITSGALTGVLIGNLEKNNDK